MKYRDEIYAQQKDIKEEMYLLKLNVDLIAYVKHINHLESKGEKVKSKSF